MKILSVLVIFLLFISTINPAYAQVRNRTIPSRTAIVTPPSEASIQHQTTPNPTTTTTTTEQTFTLPNIQLDSDTVILIEIIVIIVVIVLLIGFAKKQGRESPEFIMDRKF